MTFILDLLRMLTFRWEALRAQAERQALVGGAVSFSVGFLAYALVRNAVYAVLPEIYSRQPGLLASVLDLDLVQVLLFLLLVYIPAVVILASALAGYGLALGISRREYRAHASVLLPLWGLLFLLSAPLQWLIPHFLILGPIEISMGVLLRTLLLCVYTPWAIKQLDYLSLPQAVAVFILSGFTYPAYYLVTSFVLALPLFILLPLAILAFQRIRDYAGSMAGQRALRQHLHTLTLNPQDADAHYQLGLLQLGRRRLAEAREHFGQALRIDPNDPDHHYALGRTYELEGDWAKALEEYEETYRLRPDYGTGDIFREVGKGYLHTGSLDKGLEFLRFFLNKRGSDPEGRYWLAVALGKLGETEQMRAQLHTILEQARSNPRFFRKENRDWVYRARSTIRNSPDL